MPSIEEIRSSDLSAAMVAKETAAKPTWFVRRLGDGYEFAVEEYEAWELKYTHSTWKRNDFVFIGYSDGKTYQRIVKESMGKARELQPQIEEKKRQLTRYRNLEDKLLLEEVVDMEGDPKDTANEENKQKVLRLRAIIERLDGELEQLEQKYLKVTKNVVIEATNAEKEVAIRNWNEKGPVWPRRSLNVHTPEAAGEDRDRLLGMIGQK